jgi:hypothetical protein
MSSIPAANGSYSWPDARGAVSRDQPSAAPSATVHAAAARAVSAGSSRHRTRAAMPGPHLTTKPANRLAGNNPSSGCQSQCP